MRVGGMMMTARSLLLKVKVGATHMQHTKPGRRAEFVVTTRLL
jgi:hypothetical protein